MRFYCNCLPICRMKKERTVSRYSIILAVAIGYFVPILGLTFYGNTLFGYALGWDFFTTAITTALAGTLFFFWMISKWNYTHTSSETPEEHIEEAPPTPTEAPASAPTQDSALLHELEHYKEENLALAEKLCPHRQRKSIAQNTVRTNCCRVRNVQNLCTPPSRTATAPHPRTARLCRRT